MFVLMFVSIWLLPSVHATLPVSPPLEDYEVLREALGMEKLGRWYIRGMMRHVLNVEYTECIAWIYHYS